MPNTITPASMKTSDILNLLDADVDDPLVAALYSPSEQASWHSAPVEGPKDPNQRSQGPDPALIASTRAALKAELDRRIPIPS